MQIAPATRPICRASSLTKLCLIFSTTLKRCLLRLLHNVAKHFMRRHLNFTRGDPSFNLMFLPCQYIKINPNVKLMISYWSQFKFGWIFTHWHDKKDKFQNRLSLRHNTIFSKSSLWFDWYLIEITSHKLQVSKFQCNFRKIWPQYAMDCWPHGLKNRHHARWKCLLELVSCKLPPDQASKNWNIPFFWWWLGWWRKFWYWVSHTCIALHCTTVVYRAVGRYENPGVPVVIRRA